MSNENEVTINNGNNGGNNGNNGNSNNGNNGNSNNSGNGGNGDSGNNDNSGNGDNSHDNNNNDNYINPDVDSDIHELDDIGDSDNIDVEDHDGDNPIKRISLYDYDEVYYSFDLSRISSIVIHNSKTFAQTVSLRLEIDSTKIYKFYTNHRNTKNVKIESSFIEQDTFRQLVIDLGLYDYRFPF